MSADLWALAQAKTGVFRWSVYVTAQDVVRHLATAQGRARAIELLKTTGVTKAYVEVYRSGCWPTEELLRTVREEFKRAGLQISGGMTPTPGEGFVEAGESVIAGPLWACYSQPGALAGARRMAQVAAQIFDELMIDDFFATACVCPRCCEAKGTQSWSEFRCRLMTQVLREQIVEPASRHGCKVIVKFPQWYDRLAEFGYDAAGETAVADRVWVGTETRDPRTPQYGYAQQYEGHFNARWFGAVAGAKLGGGWFDWYDCDTALYVEQAYQTVLAGAKECVLFHYDPERFAEGGGFLDRLRSHMPRLFELAEAVTGRRTRGVTAVRPADADPGRDHYLFDALGMLGLPLVPKVAIEAGDAAAVLAAHCAAIPDLAGQVRGMLERGATVLLTSGLLAARTGDAELCRLAGYGPRPVVEAMMQPTAFVADGARVRVGGEVRLSGHLRPKEATALAEAAVDCLGEVRTPLLTRHEPDEGGKVLVLNTEWIRASDFRVDEQLNVPRWQSMVDWPRPVVDVLRRELLGRLRLTFSSPGRVGLYWFADGGGQGEANGTGSLVVLCNFNDENAGVRLIAADGQRPRPVDVELWDEAAIEVDGTVAVPARHAAMVAL